MYVYSSVCNSRGVTSNMRGDRRMWRTALHRFLCVSEAKIKNAGDHREHRPKCSDMHPFMHPIFHSSPDLDSSSPVLQVP